jgi:hypothetical protein
LGSIGNHFIGLFDREYLADERAKIADGEPIRGDEAHTRSGGLATQQEATEKTELL